MRPGTAMAAAALAAGVLAGAVQAAAGEGGYSIATAPEIVVGEEEFGSPVNGARFWRIPLGQRDLLHLHVANKALWERDLPIRFCLLAPSVTDANLARSRCAWQRTVARQADYRLRFTADAGGGWTLGAVSSTCATFQRCATGGATLPFTYEFTVRVRVFTRITLRGPRLARPGARIRFTGTVSGAEGGTVALGGATVRLARNGAFAWSTRAPSAPGDYRVRVVYRGDATHLGSEAALTYRVAR